jgi:hypothetical protein
LKINEGCVTKRIELMSVSSRILHDIPTTTNSIEAWHSAINSRTKTKNPALKVFIYLELKKIGQD